FVSSIFTYSSGFEPALRTVRTPDETSLLFRRNSINVGVAMSTRFVTVRSDMMALPVAAPVMGAVGARMPQDHETRSISPLWSASLDSPVTPVSLRNMSAMAMTVFLGRCRLNLDVRREVVALFHFAAERAIGLLFLVCDFNFRHVQAELVVWDDAAGL